MSKTLGQTLLVLIATMMVADPLMACCFPVSLDQTTVAEVTPPKSEKPPCHGSKIEIASEVPERSDSDCPGCGDCTSMMSGTEHVKTWKLFGSTSEVDPESVTVAVLIADSVEYRISPAPNIPSGSSPRVTSTPVTLKLKLHI
ncbi:MAG: hypothetical protein AB8G18_05240 [Gammaproteobacteria bacterium]